MAEQVLSVTPYTGSLLAVQLLSSAQTLVLSDFGAPVSGTLNDADGLLSALDNGSSTFDGQPITYIGSGTATPGVNVLGLTVPLGTPVDVVIFDVGGQTYFYYPDGEPNLLSAVALVINVSPAPYQVFTPLCVIEGTMIATPEGEVPVETLRPGDMVRDIDGRSHEVLWVKRRELDIPTDEKFDKWRPVRVRAGAFGPACPYDDTFLSQQHCVLMEGSWVRLTIGQRAALARAVHLVNDTTVRIARGKSRLVYCHILCAEHVVLMANGLPVESLRLSSESDRSLESDTVCEAYRLFPDLIDRQPLVAPVLARHEAQAVSHQFAAVFHRQGARPTADIA